MIPTFPQFKKLELSDWEAVEDLTRQFPPYSDFNFTSLWAWDINGGRTASLLNDNLVIRFTDYDTLDPFYSFLGSHDQARTAHTLILQAKNEGISPVLRLVPHTSVHQIEDVQLQITADQNHFDYLYLTEMIASLQGNQYKSKRKSYNRFVEEYPEARFEVLSLHDPLVQEQIVSVIHDWERQRLTDHKESKIEHEEMAIRKLFISSTNSLFIGAIMHKSKMIAFTVEELVSPTCSIGHFWKADTAYHGLYDYLAREMARYLRENDVLYWNWEQDLGITTLRSSKSSYRPSDFLKKFTVREA